MSRGMGKLQRDIFGVILDHGKPMTYTDIVARLCDVDPSKVRLIRSSSLARNFRRAIHSMVQRSELIALGEGGPEEPHRYFFHPMFLEMHRDTEALQAALKADPGAETAVAIEGTKLSIALKRAIIELGSTRAVESQIHSSP